MKEIAKGRVWKFGNDLDMDRDIFPFRYVLETSSGIPLEKLASHVMEPVNPDFGQSVQKGDFLVAGRNFGVGKAHMEGPASLKILGISAVIADSISPTFFRNAVYVALPLLTGEGISKKINQGDELEVNLLTGEIRKQATGEVLRAKPVVGPEHPLFPIMEAGGQVEYIRKRVQSMKL